MIYCGALFRPGRPRFVLGAASLFCHGHQSPVTPLPSPIQGRSGRRGGAAGWELTWPGPGGQDQMEGRSGLALAGSPARWKELFSHLRVWLSCSLEDLGCQPVSPANEPPLFFSVDWIHSLELGT